MSLTRKLMLSATAVVVPVALVTALGVGPAAAGTPPFPASGKVSCTGMNIKVKFSPGLQLTAGGNTVTFKGKLSGCTVSGSTDAITSGKLTGNTTGSGSGLVGLATGSMNPINLSISWKGTHNGAKASFTPSTVTAIGFMPAVDGSGNSGFEIPSPGSGGSVTGSFAGSVTDESFAYSSQTASQIQAQSGKHGVKKLTLVSGNITLP